MSIPHLSNLRPATLFCEALPSGKPGERKSSDWLPAQAHCLRSGGNRYCRPSRGTMHCPNCGMLMLVDQKCGRSQGDP